MQENRSRDPLKRDFVMKINATRLMYILWSSAIILEWGFVTVVDRAYWNVRRTQFLLSPKHIENILINQLWKWSSQSNPRKFMYILNVWATLISNLNHSTFVTICILNWIAWLWRKSLNMEYWTSELKYWTLLSE